jgi:hypothetical protein
MTPFPREIDNPASLMPDLAELRNTALAQGDFNSAVLLSHVHAWLFWINENRIVLAALQNVTVENKKKKKNEEEKQGES